LPDGSVKSCKDDYHSPRRKVANEPFKRVADFHKTTYLRIQDLYKKSKGTVTLAQLNEWGINLSRPVEFSMEGGLYNAYFIKFLIKQISKTEYKILEHGKQF
jgi:hypothetical protein